MLYIAMGDGGSGGDPQGNGQRLDTHLGKILRIDVDVAPGSATPYEVPPDNPFVNEADAKPEIWLYRPAQSVADALRPRRPATCGSATSARTPGRRSTSRGPARRA